MPSPHRSSCSVARGREGTCEWGKEGVHKGGRGGEGLHKETSVSGQKRGGGGIFTRRHLAREVPGLLSCRLLISKGQVAAESSALMSQTILHQGQKEGRGGGTNRK